MAPADHPEAVAPPAITSNNKTTVPPASSAPVNASLVLNHRPTFILNGPAPEGLSFGPWVQRIGLLLRKYRLTLVLEAHPAEPSQLQLWLDKNDVAYPLLCDHVTSTDLSIIGSVDDVHAAIAKLRRIYPPDDDHCYSQHPELRPDPKTNGGKGKTTAQGKNAAAVDSSESQSVSAYAARSHIPSSLAPASATAALARAQTASENASTSDFAFIVDSGATEHMTAHAFFFVPGTYEAFVNPRRIILGDDHDIPALGAGDIAYLARIGQGDVRIRFQRVWYAPRLGTTLISVNRLGSNGLLTTFDNPWCLITTKASGAVVARAALKPRGWTIEGAVDASNVANARTAATKAIWHVRLSHSSNVNRLDELVDGYSVTKSPSSLDDFCNACAMGKSHRQPFPTSTTTVSAILELLTVDIAGAPKDHPSRLGFRYSMTVTDVHSKLKFAILLRIGQRQLPC